MYNAYFGFSDSPFVNNLDQRFLYLSENHREVLAALLYFVNQRKEFALVCGDVGTGKTMLISSFLSRIPGSVHAIMISNPDVGYLEILQCIARNLKVPASSGNVLELIDHVKAALTRALGNGKRYVLIIDEAHLLSDRSLEHIRLLSNIESPTQKLLQILLVGQCELSPKLNRPEMRQLRQRININRFLAPMDISETIDYIDYRLRIVGGSYDACFDPTCKHLIYKITQGVPRRINLICDNALLICAARRLRKIGPEVIKMADEALRSDLMFTPSSLHGRRTGFATWKLWRMLVLVGSCLILSVTGAGTLGYRGLLGENLQRTLQGITEKALVPISGVSRSTSEDLKPEHDNATAHEEKYNTAPGFTFFTNDPGKHAAHPSISAGGSSLAAGRPFNIHERAPLSMDAVQPQGAEMPSSGIKQDNPAGKSRAIPPRGQKASSDHQTTSEHRSALFSDSRLAEARRSTASAPPMPGAREGEEGRNLHSPLTSPVEDKEPGRAPHSIEGADIPRPSAERRDGPPTSEGGAPESPSMVGRSGQGEATSSKSRRVQQRSKGQREPFVERLPSSHSTPHVIVKRGDTLSGIVSRWYPGNPGSAIEAILAANPFIVDRNKIYPGQKILLPQLHGAAQRLPLGGRRDLYYYAYSNTDSPRELQRVTSRLRQSRIKYTVVNTGDAAGGHSYQIFLGGYREATDLETALNRIHTENIEKEASNEAEDETAAYFLYP